MRMVVISLAACLLTAAAHADVPAWWTTRGVLVSGVPTNDYAAVNQGQVKNMAVQAAAEMNVSLPGGAGPGATALINSFSITNNYLPANIGQVKTMAKPFYDRLIAAGYTNAYPWTGAPNDYALANIGQLKNLFAWDLTTDSVGDGIPDWWRRAHFAGDGTTTNSTSCASCDVDGDGFSTLEEFLGGSDPTNSNSVPLSITAQVIPTPNSAGWNNTNVVVHFIVTGGNAPVSYTPDIPINVETNDCLVTGLATDATGYTLTAGALVNIDKTSPAITLDPGQGQTNDLSHPLLFVGYADTNGLAWSGVDLSTLSITLDGVDVTTKFYRFEAGAVLSTNLAQGTYTWSASVADFAANVTTVSNTFYATGAVNTNAPPMDNLDLTNAVTVLPDMPEVWVQGTVSGGTASVVYASVNGGPAIPMNQSTNIFGYLLPLEPGTNVIVLTSADSTTNNLSSKVLVVERSTRYQASLTSPSFGTFANGAAQSVAGTVSALDATTPVQSVTVNGAASTSFTVNGDGSASYSASAPAPCSVWPIVVTICWANGFCQNVPLGLLEGYEILHKEINVDSAGVSSEYNPGGGGDCLWAATGESIASTISYTFDCGSGVNGAGTYSEIQGGCFRSPPTLDQATWQVTSSWSTNYAMLQPPRDLTLGEEHSSMTQTPCTGAVAQCSVDRTTWTGNSLTYRAPIYYGRDTPVIFTLEGLSYATVGNDVMDLTQVKYRGQTPISVTGDSASYLVTVTGGQEYTIDEQSLTWPESSSSSSWPAGNGYCAGTETHQSHLLSFTGFHNQEVGGSIYVEGVKGDSCSIFGWGTGPYTQPSSADNGSYVKPVGKKQTTTGTSHIAMQGTAGDRGICNSVYTNCWSAAESDAFNSGKLRITTKGLPAGTYKFKVTVSIFEKVAGFAGADAYVYPAGQDVIGKHLHSSDQIAKTSNFSTNLTVAVTNSSPSEEVEIMRYDIQGAISPNRWGSSEVTTTISVQPIPP